MNMSYLLMKACKHGVYGCCLKCGHRHCEDGFKKLCHKDHTKEMEKLAREFTKEDWERIRKMSKKKN